VQIRAVMGNMPLDLSMKGDRRMLNELEIEQYHQDGFVIPRFQMPEEVIESVKNCTPL
jgi:hypothetical protein